MSRNGRKRFLPFLDTFGSRISEKVSRNGRNDKMFLEMGESVNGRKRFLPFLDTFVSKIIENVSRNRRNDKKCLEMGENENPFSPISRHFCV